VIGWLERLGDRPERALPDVDDDLRPAEQVERPGGPDAGGDQDRPVRLLDVPDRDRPRQSGPASPGRDPRDLPLEDEVVAEVVRRQRARCQDLPSVWVDGA
jgi:hypothetical protein